MNGVSQLKIYSQKQIINDYIPLLAEKNIYIYINSFKDILKTWIFKNYFNNNIINKINGCLVQDVSQGVNLYTRNKVALQSDHFIDQQYKQITLTKIMVDFISGFFRCHKNQANRSIVKLWLTVRPLLPKTLAWRIRIICC